MIPEKFKVGRGRLPSLGSYPFRDSKKEEVRQIFLFTNHILLTTRAKENGRLHLVKVSYIVAVGKNHTHVYSSTEF